MRNAYLFQSAIVPVRLAVLSGFVDTCCDEDDHAGQGSASGFTANYRETPCSSPENHRRLRWLIECPSRCPLEYVRFRWGPCPPLLFGIDYPRDLEPRSSLTDHLGYSGFQTTLVLEHGRPSDRLNPRPYQDVHELVRWWQGRK